MHFETGAASMRWTESIGSRMLGIASLAVNFDRSGSACDPGVYHLREDGPGRRRPKRLPSGRQLQVNSTGCRAERLLLARKHQVTLPRGARARQEARLPYPYPETEVQKMTKPLLPKSMFTPSKILPPVYFDVGSAMGIGNIITNRHEPTLAIGRILN